MGLCGNKSALAAVKVQQYEVFSTIHVSKHFTNNESDFKIK